MPSAANPLEIRTCTRQVLTALVDALDLAYSVRYPEAATLSDLAARPAEPLPDRALIWVASEGVVYRWAPASTLPPAPPYVVQPLEPLQAGNGRWLRQSSALTLGPAYFRPLHRVRTGFAKTVQIYEGQDDAQLERTYGQMPALLVEFVSDDLQVKSYRHGAINACELRFIVHCLAANFRGDASALIGSEVAGDSEPGVLDLIGAVRYLLAGSTLGLAPGVKFTDVTGQAQIIVSDLAQRRFRAELDLTVKASVHIVDEDLLPQPEVWVERRDANTAGPAPFDPANHVARGYVIDPGATLSAAPVPGVAYVVGQVVSSSPGVHTFEPDADTYRDLATSGVLHYTAVAAGAEPPPQPRSTLRVGVTRTDATRVIADTLLCAYLVPSGANPGDPFRAA